MMKDIPATITDLISRQEFDCKVATRLRDWVYRSTRFADYVRLNEAKIASKIRKAKSSDQQRDLGLELYVACALVDHGFSVTPEPTKNTKPTKKGPDYLVTWHGIDIYVEVRRFQERKQVADWRNHCEALKVEVEPKLETTDVHLQVFANYSNFRHYPGLRRPLAEFGGKIDELRAFIWDKVESPPTVRTRYKVSCLPPGFAYLTVKAHGRGRFCYSYPVQLLKEEQRLILGISEKSKQTVCGQANLLVFWLTNIEETYDDFRLIRVKSGHSQDVVVS